MLLAEHCLALVLLYHEVYCLLSVVQVELVVLSLLLLLRLLIIIFSRVRVIIASTATSSSVIVAHGSSLCGLGLGKPVLWWTSKYLLLELDLLAILLVCT